MDKRITRLSPLMEEMDMAEFCALGAAMFGGGWMTRMAEMLGLDYATVKRYKAGDLPIPRSVAMLIRLLAVKWRIKCM